MKFEPFHFVVEVPFWFQFANLKLEKLKLDQEAINLHAAIELSLGKAAMAAAAGRLTLSADAIEASTASNSTAFTPTCIKIPLRLENFNLMEDFKALKKKQILEEEANAVSQQLKVDFGQHTRWLIS
jgi:hypothetical protein